jgi:transcriptional regulator of NAD metabolism
MTNRGSSWCAGEEITEEQRQVFDHLNRVRAQAIEHARIAQRLSAERRELIEQLTRLAIPAEARRTTTADTDDEPG